MTDADVKRQRFLERLAKAGITEEQWARARGEYQADLSKLDAPTAHERFRALQDIGAKAQIAALAKVQSMLADDAPVVVRGRRPIVFEVGMFALTVLQRLTRAAGKPADLGPLRVAKAVKLVDVERLAESALASLDPDLRADVIARAEQDVRERICPSADDVSAVRAYRIMQLTGAIDVRVQHADPVTGLAPLQEEIFASQVATERPRPCLRVGTTNPDRTLGWVFRDSSGTWVIDVSDHPLAQDAADDIRWFMDQPAGADNATNQEAMAFLGALGEFLGKTLAVEVLD